MNQPVDGVIGCICPETDKELSYLLRYLFSGMFGIAAFDILSGIIGGLVLVIWTWRKRGRVIAARG